MNPPLKILIADDHQLVIDGLKAIILSDKRLQFCAEANNGEEVLNFLKYSTVDLILMDIDMPIMNGIEATEEIKKLYPSIKILILSMHNEKGMITKAVECGADGFLLKNSSQDELIEGVLKVASGAKFFSPQVTLTLLSKDEVNVANDSNVAILNELTEREIEIIKLISEGFSNKEIGDKLFISHRTVDTHRTNLMKKLDVHNIAGIVRFAIHNKLLD